MARSRDILFYDAECGLCDRMVRFTAARDHAGRLAYAPLGGETFRALLPPEVRQRLPEGVVLRTRSGRVYTRHHASLLVLHRLGGRWRWVAQAGLAVPAPLRNLVYTVIARLRHRLLPPPKACTPPPESLRARILP